MQIVMRVNTECMRVKKMSRENYMILEVNRRHKSEGGKYRVTEKNKKVQQVLKEKVKWTGGEKCEEGNKGLRGKMKGTKAKEENERLRVKIKGAGSANGKNKMHVGTNVNGGKEG